MDKISFAEAQKKGELVDKSGYHQPQNHSRHMNCGCELTTGKGAYRDMTFKMPSGEIVHFYHQSPVVIEQNGKYRLDNCRYHTKSTKERINRYLPSGFKLIQRDFDWYIKSWNPETDYENRDYERMEFSNGMVVEK